MASLRHWLVKQEPEDYSWEQLLVDGGTDWTGVRNHQAAANLKGMRVGDLVLVYHSVGPKSVVGIAKVAQEAFPDATAEEPGWVAVRLEPVETLKRPVTLAEIKEHSVLRDLPLVRQSRLSVMPIPAPAYRTLVKLSNTPRP